MKISFKEAYREVIDAHIQIENLFHNQPTDGKRKPFLTYFHPNFTKISVDGKVEGFSDLEKWFKSAAGSRPHVKIQVKNWKEIFNSDTNVVVAYEEFQQVDETKFLRRMSTAVLVPDNERLVWLHLQETWIK